MNEDDEDDPCARCWDGMWLSTYSTLTELTLGGQTSVVLRRGNAKRFLLVRLRERDAESLERGGGVEVIITPTKGAFEAVVMSQQTRCPGSDRKLWKAENLVTANFGDGADDANATPHTPREPITPRTPRIPHSNKPESVRAVFTMTADDTLDFAAGYYWLSLVSLPDMDSEADIVINPVRAKDMRRRLRTLKPVTQRAGARERARPGGPLPGSKTARRAQRRAVKAAKKRQKAMQPSANAPVDADGNRSGDHKSADTKGHAEVELGPTELDKKHDPSDSDSTDSDSTDSDSDDSGDEDDSKRPGMSRKSASSHDMKADDEQFTWDMVMVFRVGDRSKVMPISAGANRQMTEREFFSVKTARIVKKLSNAKLKTYIYRGVDPDLVFCLIGATEARLQQEADRTDYELELDSDACIEQGMRLGIRLAKLTRSDDHLAEAITTDKWASVFGKYDRYEPANAWRQDLYKRYVDQGERHPNTFFRASDRLKLTVSIVEAEAIVGGAGLRLSRAQEKENHPLMAFFALHEEHSLMLLERRWNKWSRVLKQPLNGIRNYMGEQVAFYFAFIQFYNLWLIGPAVFGAVCFAWQMGVGRVDVPVMPVFGVAMIVWCTLLIEMWKRTESRYHVRWGQVNFESTEQPRPEFDGRWEPSPINGKLVETFPRSEKLTRALWAQTVVWTLIILVLGLVASIFIFRAFLISELGDRGGYIAAVANGVQIHVSNMLFGYVSRALNDYENHRTDSEYENALIAKNYVFKFINSYNSLFYIAYFQRYDSGVGGCGADGCLPQLQQQLGTIFVTRLIFNNLIEYYNPEYRVTRWLNTSYVHDAEVEARNLEKSPAERQYALPPYDSTLEDFDELMIQFGYVTLFVVAFPITPLLALFNNFVETRLDAYKLLNLTRRPEPKGAANIGTWKTLLDMTGFIAVVTNVSLLVFETELVDDWFPGLAAKYFVFVVAEHLLIVLKFALAYFVDDEPEEVRMHIHRQEYIVNVLINGIEEDEENVDASLRAFSDSRPDIRGDGDDGQPEDELVAQYFDLDKAQEYNFEDEHINY